MAESSNRDKDIFLQALELTSSTERAAFLAQACGADDGLRRQVEAMLQAQATPDSFLEKPAAALGITTDAIQEISGADRQPRADRGTRIGPYKLLEQIGEGGMGVVYMAEQQEPVRRMVALKIIKPGMDSGQVLARFEAERQALALMDHPNIARVLDANATADGRPFFVMELVKGTPITKFCDERRLSLRQRLELFVSVCQAIQHAHQKGVIHRDIKPSNVLVALYDDKPVPKVIDFGVAKATGQALTNKTLHTGFGAILGTPEYMSPEQATFNQLDIDTRSDVYALGVLLYELLTGTTPVDKIRLKETALLEVLRLVREEEPARPSVKLSTTQARASIAATRGTDSDKLAQLLRGELDWIVMKALDKERNRRYETAAGLARDVERYLKDELVEARPPSAGYRLRKFVKRHRVAVLTAALVLLAILGGIIGTTAGMLRAWDAEAKADEARQTAEGNKIVAEALKEQAIGNAQEAEKVSRRAEENEKKAKAAVAEAKAALSFLGSTVISAQLDGLIKRGEIQPVTLHEALSRSQEHIPTMFGQQPLAEATVRFFVGSGFVSLGDAKAGIQQLERSYAIRKEQLGPTHPDTVMVMVNLALAAAANDDPARAISLFKQAIAINKENTKKTADQESVWGIDMLMEFLADAHEQAKQYDDSIRIRRELVAIHRDSGDAGGNLAESLHALGRCLVAAGKPKDAEPVLRESTGLYERQRGPENDWFRFVVLGDLGACLLAQKKYVEAEPLLTRSFEDLLKRQGTDPRKGPVIGYWCAEVGERLAELYDATGRKDEALKLRKKLSPESKKK